MGKVSVAICREHRAEQPSSFFPLWDLKHYEYGISINTTLRRLYLSMRLLQILQYKPEYVCKWQDIRTARKKQQEE